MYKIIWVVVLAFLPIACNESCKPDAEVLQNTKQTISEISQVYHQKHDYYNQVKQASGQQNQDLINLNFWLKMDSVTIELLNDSLRLYNLCAITPDRMLKITQRQKNAHDSIMQLINSLQIK